MQGAGRAAAHEAARAGPGEAGVGPLQVRSVSDAAVFSWERLV